MLHQAYYLENVFYVNFILSLYFIVGNSKNLYKSIDDIIVNTQNSTNGIIPDVS